MNKKILAIVITISIILSVMFVPSAVFAADEDTTAAPEAASDVNIEDKALTPAEIFCEALMNADSADEMDKLKQSVSEDIISEIPEAKKAEIEEKYDSFNKKPETSAADETVEDNTENIVYEVPEFIYAGRFLPPVKMPAVRRMKMLKSAPAKDNGLKINKTAKDNKDGTYTINLEAYATGEKVITVEKEAVPTDFILVLDQSGSMARSDMTSLGSYDFYSGTDSQNENLYSVRHNGGKANLYFADSKGNYVPVSVEKSGRETEPEKNVYTPTGSLKNQQYYDKTEPLYALKGGKYLKVSISRKGGFFSKYKFTYKLSDGTEIAYSETRDAVPSFSTDDGKLYTMVTVPHVMEYTYTYKYNNGSGDILIGTSVGENTLFNKYLYKYTPGGKTISRMNALRVALKNFTNTVLVKADGADGVHGTHDDIKHRIAMVGFAGGSASEHPEFGSTNNTEIFVGKNEYNYNHLLRETTDEAQFKNVFQDMSTDEGRINISDSIGLLRADGQTFTDKGLELAKNILDRNGLNPGEKRNRVVIVFSDGGVNKGSADFSRDAAYTAMGIADNIKATGATVYSIGMRPEADASDDFHIPGHTVWGESGKQWENACNWFLHNISNNNGVKRNPGYYLSAKNTSELNNVFQQIAIQVESGGSSTTLNEKSVIKDIIAPEFVTPENTSEITIETYECTGEDSWKKNTDAMGAHAAINGDTVSVTGFDFSKNYVGPIKTNGNVTAYRGHKLVVSFKVKSKPGFLGGNDICTNAGAGIYENETSDKPVGEFPKPQVNVPVPEIKDIKVTAKDIYAYLKGNITADELKNKVSVKYGETVLDLTKPGYGIDPWQYKYLDIKVSAPAGFTDIREDGTYTFTVSVSPKTDGTKGEVSGSSKYTEKTGTATAAIKVMKPEITWKDSEIELGSVPSYAMDNYVGTVWKYGGASASTLSPIVGTAPDIAFTYTPAQTALYKDTKVNVTSEINGEDITSYVSYVHENCSFEGCTWDNSCEFIVHIKVFDLIITKKADKLYSPDDSFIFTVKGPSGKTMKAVIKGTGSVTLKDLPTGDYTVTENGKWSWRYSCAEPSKTVTASDIKGGSAEAVFENSLVKDTWLSFVSYCENRWQPDGTIKSSLIKGIKKIVKSLGFEGGPQL